MTYLQLGTIFFMLAAIFSLMLSLAPGGLLMIIAIIQCLAAVVFLIGAAIESND